MLAASLRSIKALSPVLTHQKEDQCNDDQYHQYQPNDLPGAEGPFTAYLAGKAVDGKLVGFVFVDVGADPDGQQHVFDAYAVQLGA